MVWDFGRELWGSWVKERKRKRRRETAMQMGKKEKKGWERKGRTKTALGEKKGTNWTAGSGAPFQQWS